MAYLEIFTPIPGWLQLTIRDDINHKICIVLIL